MKHHSVSLLTYAVSAVCGRAACLSCTDPQDAERLQAEPHVSGEDGTGEKRARSALVVDDDEDWAAALCDALEAAGCTARYVTSGLEAVREYRDQPTDVVFLDMHMPPMHAPETLRELKGVDPSVKVVVVTAYAQSKPELTRHTKSAGPFDFVLKEELAEKIDQILERVRQNPPRDPL